MIIPIYNVELFLAKCLDSLAGQTYPNLEFLLVDDGSTDNSGAICEQYAARDARFRVLRQENQGASAARNRGMEAAAGDWLGFVDSDDWIEPDFYETLYRTAIAHGADVASCGYYINDRKLLGTEQVIVYEGRSIVYQLLEMHFAASSLCNKIYRASLKPQLHNRQDIHFTEDFQANYEVCKAARRMAFIDRCLYHYTMRETGCVWHYRPEENRRAAEMAEELAMAERTDARAYNACLRRCIILRLTEINQAIKCQLDRPDLVKLREPLLRDYQRMTQREILSAKERWSVRLLMYAPELYRWIVWEKKRLRGV